MPDRISQELLEAAKKAEAVEAHRIWAQLLAERVAATSASKRLRAGAAEELETAGGAAPLGPSLPPPPPLQTHPTPTQSTGFAPPLPLDFAALDPPPPPLGAGSAAISTEQPSAPPSDSEDDHDHDHGHAPGGAPSRRGRAAAAGPRPRIASRDPLSRAEATKEKNRRAQQRFRNKQKSRMEALEAEVVRLRAALAERGVDPADLLADHHDALQALEHLPQPALQPEQAQQPPSLDTMHADLEAWLEECQGVARPAAVRFLQEWTQMGDDARRLHHRSLQTRRAAGDSAGVALWVNTQVESRGTPPPAEGSPPRGGGTEQAAAAPTPLPRRVSADALAAALPQVASR